MASRILDKILGIACFVMVIFLLFSALVVLFVEEPTVNPVRAEYNTGY